MHDGKEIVLIAGYGGSGKDTAAKIISEVTGLQYRHSTSWTAAEEFYNEIEADKWHDYGLCQGNFGSVQECYDKRKYYRRAWAEFIKRYNKEGTELYVTSIERGNQILTGIRQMREIQACYGAGLIDWSIWISKDGANSETDTTQEYGPELCDCIIQNNDTVHVLRRKLERLFGPHSYAA